jgi:uncharacterized membrane-anchored protein
MLGVQPMISPKARGFVAALALLLILGWVNYSIARKETLLAEGRVIYLQLAPVDPRSMLQGDYMALDYQLSRDATAALAASSGIDGQPAGIPNQDGRLVGMLDARGVAHFARLESAAPLAPQELLLRYRVRNGQLKFATNAFFFQEGSDAELQPARYGMFRVDRQGEMLLTHLCDADLRILAGTE